MPSSFARPASMARRGAGSSAPPTSPSTPSTPFDTALLSSQACRAEAERAGRDQLELLDRLFKDNQRESKSAARALIVGTTKAMEQLLQSTAALEAAAAERVGALRRHQQALTEGGHRALREQRDGYQQTVDTLSQQLASEKSEAMQTQATLSAALERERTERAWDEEVAGSKSAMLEHEVSRLEAALVAQQAAAEAERTELRGRVAVAEAARDRAVGSVEGLRGSYHAQLCEITRAKVDTEALLREEIARAIAARLEAESVIVDLHQSREEAALQAVAFERRLQNAEALTSQVHTTMAGRVDELRRLQATALGMTSDTGRRDGEWSSLARRSQSAAETVTISSRSRGRLYAELLRAKSEGQLP